MIKLFVLTRTIDAPDDDPRERDIEVDRREITAADARTAFEEYWFKNSSNWELRHYDYDDGRGGFPEFLMAHWVGKYAQGEITIEDHGRII